MAGFLSNGLLMLVLHFLSNHIAHCCCVPVDGTHRQISAISAIDVPLEETEEARLIPDRYITPIVIDIGPTISN